MSSNAKAVLEILIEKNEDSTMFGTNPGASNAKAYGSDKSVSPRSRVCHCERAPTVTLQKIIIVVIIIIRKISFKVETHPTCILPILPSCV